MSDSSSLLHEHAGALRRLAVRLLDGDADRAADAVQETWLRVAATQRSLPDLARPKAWLEQVLRNVTKQFGRDESRRRRREAIAARSEAFESVDQLAERREAFAALSRAVTALPTEQQDVVLARYFEDLPPREIAKRLDLPVELVYSRLDTARRRLRRELGQDLGDDGWRRGLCALVAVPASSVQRHVMASAVAESRSSSRYGVRVVVTATTAAIMTQTKMLLAAGALAAAGLLAFQFLGTGAPQLDWVPDAAQDGGTPMPIQADPTGAAVVERTPTPEAEPPSTSSDDAGLFELEIRIVNADDVPACNYPFLIAPVGEDLNRTFTGPDGSVILRWRGLAPTMRVLLSPEGFSHELVALSMHELRVNDRAGVTLRTEQRCPNQRYPKAAASFMGVSALPLASVSAPVLPLRIDDDGLAHFVSGRVTTDELPATDDGPSLRFVLGKNRLLNEAEPTASCLIEGTVRRPDGTPAQGATVIVGSDPEAGVYTASTRTGPDGRYVIEVEGNDPVVVRFGGGDFGVAHAPFAPTVSGSDSPRPVIDAVLDRGRELAATVIAPDGQGIAGMRVEVRPSGDASTVDGSVTGAGGTFRIPNVADVAFDVMVFAADSAIPCATARGVRVLPGLTIRVDRDVGSVDARMPAASPAESFELLWIDGVSDRAQLVRRPMWGEKDKPMDPVTLPVGPYELFAAGLASGWRLQGRLQIASGLEGPMPFVGPGLEEPGRMVRARQGDGWSHGSRLTIERVTDSVVIEVGALDAARPGLSLPAGRYRVRDGDGVVHEVEVRAGEEIDLGVLAETG